MTGSTVRRCRLLVRVCDVQRRVVLPPNASSPADVGVFVHSTQADERARRARLEQTSFNQSGDFWAADLDTGNSYTLEIVPGGDFFQLIQPFALMATNETETHFTALAVGPYQHSRGTSREFRKREENTRLADSILNNRLDLRIVVLRRTSTINSTVLEVRLTRVVRPEPLRYLPRTPFASLPRGGIVKEVFPERTRQLPTEATTHVVYAGVPPSAIQPSSSSVAIAALDGAGLQLPVSSRYPWVNFAFAPRSPALQSPRRNTPTRTATQPIPDSVWLLFRARGNPGAIVTWLPHSFIGGNPDSERWPRRTPATYFSANEEGLAFEQTWADWPEFSELLIHGSSLSPLAAPPSRRQRAEQVQRMQPLDRARYFNSRPPLGTPPVGAAPPQTLLLEQTPTARDYRACPFRITWFIHPNPPRPWPDYPLGRDYIDMARRYLLWGGVGPTGVIDDATPGSHYIVPTMLLTRDPRRLVIFPILNWTPPQTVRLDQFDVIQSEIVFLVQQWLLRTREETSLAELPYQDWGRVSHLPVAAKPEVHSVTIATFSSPSQQIHTVLSSPARPFFGKVVMIAPVGVAGTGGPQQQVQQVLHRTHPVRLRVYSMDAEWGDPMLLRSYTSPRYVTRQDTRVVRSPLAGVPTTTDQVTSSYSTILRNGYDPTPRRSLPPESSYELPPVDPYFPSSVSVAPTVAIAHFPERGWEGSGFVPIGTGMNGRVPRRNAESLHHFFVQWFLYHSHTT